MPLRFIICSDPRTGGHMLASALNRHSQLRVAGEIFVRPELFGLPPRPPRADERYAVRLVEAAWRHFEGFIIHRRFTRGLQVLGGSPEVRVIFLRREDWLAQLASEELAQQTGIWHVAPPGVDYLSDDGCAEPPPASAALKIPPAACHRYRQAVLRREAAARHLLRRNPRCELTYEQLTVDWESALERVQRFLDLPHETLTPATQRQERRPLDEVIANLAELRRHFGGRPLRGCD